MYVEKKADIAPANSLSCEGKDIDYTRDKQRVFQCLFTVPRTRAQVETLTGIRINSVCYYVGMLANDGKVKVHHKGICPVTRHDNVEFLTTNPELFPKDKPFSFWDKWEGVKYD